jgi:uncharacterized protein YdeI (YjbR/CyaY-like superfamily)
MEKESSKTPMHKNEKWSNELSILASVIHQAPLEKTIKWGAEEFTFNGNNVVSYGGFKHYFALWFYNGVFLSDKYKVLVNAQDGKTKSLRQWRFSSVEEMDEKKILEYITEAIEIEKKGLKIEPEKFKPVEAPKLLTDAFAGDKNLDLAFKKLSPGKQKEYILYIIEAKQETTKFKRLEKIKPMVLSGVGLNDKYR